MIISINIIETNLGVFLYESIGMFSYTVGIYMIEYFINNRELYSKNTVDQIIE
jgi:hypothetical protein